ncbi:RNA polymerase II transcriptional coactivator-like [Maniola jurtina]|uniref:RNA polymerase II transcriptional coactivator-like n=1 Tax=Maniola jurtina TaxID=191418 RepID=UPI001E68BE41|nr:RNA polymerase II transcriptional coactivator-like [Maniola jurtina]
MPNNKNEGGRSSSERDEGPVDRNQPPEKKAKMDAKKKRKEFKWVLQGKKLVKIREFMGIVYIDIREFYEKNGEMFPGPNGISLTPDMWKRLLSLSDEINKAVRSLH